MAGTLPEISNCCPPSCADPLIVNLPGPKGDGGAPCIPCNDGKNAYTTLTADFTMPAEGGNVMAEMVSSDWAAIGQILFVQNAGWMKVIDATDSTHLTLQNIKDTAGEMYLDNVVPGTNIPTGSRVVPGGEQGAAGAMAGDALLKSNNLSDVTNAATSRNNLGLGTAAVQNVGAFCQTANNLNDVTPATARTNLGLAIGSNVQAWDADLDALAALATAADKLPYFTGLHAAALTALTAFMRTVLAAADAVTARTTLGKVGVRYGVLGSLTGVDLNVSNNDNAMNIESTRYRIDKVIVENASISLTTVTAGVFTAAGGAGTTIAADQALATLTAASKFMEMSLQAITGTDVFTPSPLYIRTGTAQGVAATANFWLLGWRFD